MCSWVGTWCGDWCSCVDAVIGGGLVMCSCLGLVLGVVIGALGLVRTLVVVVWFGDVFLGWCGEIDIIRT